MNFDLSEDQQLFRAAVERFLGPVDIAARRQVRAMPGAYDRNRWASMAELGFLALLAPEDQGGMDGSIIDLAVIAEAFGQGLAVDPWLDNAALPIRLLALAGVGEALEPFLEGSKIAAFAFAEDGERYSVNPVHSHAKTRGHGYVLSGEKTFVINGGLADAFIVTAQCDGQSELFLVPAASEGVHVRPYRIADGSEAAQVFLRNVALPAEARVAAGPDVMNRVIAEIRVLASAEMVGLSQRLLDDTVQYVKDRHQFGVAIGSFQANQHRLVDCYAALEQMRSMQLRTLLSAHNSAPGWEEAAAGAKAFISQNSAQIAKSAVQLHGGMGITDELAIGHAVKRVLLLGRLFGDAYTHLKIYAEAA